MVREQSDAVVVEAQIDPKSPANALAVAGCRSLLILRTRTASLPVGFLILLAIYKRDLSVQLKILKGTFSKEVKKLIEVLNRLRYLKNTYLNS